MPSLISRAVRLGALAALACAAYFSLRMALANHVFHDGTAAGARRALALEPDNAVYALRAGHSARAAALQPRFAEAWIEMGLAAERSGQFEQAGGYFEHAAAVDSTYTPVWTLANFYARRHDSARLLAAAKRALRIGDPRHYDPAPLFRLAWSASSDPQQGIPPLESIEARYLDFLLATSRMEAAAPVAERLLAHPELHDWLPLLAYCDRLLAAGDADLAVHFWNAFIGRTAPERPLLDADADVALTNGDFAWEPVQHGFDWRVLDVSGVTLIRLGPPSGMRIVLDGQQGERCQMLEQLIPVIAGTPYRLQVRYRSDAISVRWRILDAVTHREIHTDAMPLSSPVDADATVRFTTPSGVRLALLALVYERVPGMARIAGTLELQRVTLGFDK